MTVGVGIGEDLLKQMEEAFKNGETSDDTFKALTIRAKFYEQICKMRKLVGGYDIVNDEDEEEFVGEVSVRKMLKGAAQISPTVAIRE